MSINPDNRDKRYKFLNSCKYITLYINLHINKIVCSLYKSHIYIINICYVHHIFNKYFLQLCVLYMLIYIDNSVFFLNSFNYFDLVI